MIVIIAEGTWMSIDDVDELQLFKQLLRFIVFSDHNTYFQ